MRKEPTVEEVAGQNTLSKGAMKGNDSELDHPLRAETAEGSYKEEHTIPKEETERELTTQERNSVTTTKAYKQSPKPQMDEEMHEPTENLFGTNFVTEKYTKKGM